MSWTVITSGLVDISRVSDRAGMTLAGTGGGFDGVGDVEVRATGCNSGEECESEVKNCGGVEVELCFTEGWVVNKVAPYGEAVIESGAVAGMLRVVLAVGKCATEGSNMVAGIRGVGLCFDSISTHIFTDCVMLSGRNNSTGMQRDIDTDGAAQG